MKKLPDKPSELIKLALEDLREAEKRPDVIIDMGTWYSKVNDTCVVCLAGAVMLNRLECEIQFALPSDFTESKKLHALDAFRKGWIYTGLGYMGYGCPSILPDYHVVVSYHLNKEKFYEDMEQMITLLEEAGL